MCHIYQDLKIREASRIQLSQAEQATLLETRLTKGGSAVNDLGEVESTGAPMGLGLPSSWFCESPQVWREKTAE